MMKSTKKPPTTATVPVVAYVRMSSDKQEDSPEQQRAELRKLAAAHGYEIIREYFDSSRSGTSAKQRAEFQRMMRDVQTAPDFRYILVWDQDRYGRFDAVEANHYWYLLREAGIQIHSVAQGIIRTDELGEWLKASIAQHGKRQYVVDLGRNSMRGQLKAAKAGVHTTRIPYGYIHVITSPDGEQSIRVKRNSRIGKPKGWTTRLVVSDVAQEVETIRWLFNEYATTRCSIRSLAVRLNAKGLPSPQGNKWRVSVVQKILENEIYTGTIAWGRERHGALHQVDERGEIGAPSTAKKSRASVVVPNAHPGIIDHETFEVVRQRIASRRASRTNPRAGGMLLAGLVNCGHCGGKMYGQTNNPGNGKSYPYYCCSNNAIMGICQGFRVRGDHLEEFIIGLLKERLLSPKAIETLRGKIEKQVAERVKRRPARGNQLQQQIADLDRRIKRGTANLLEADPRHVRDMSDALSELRTQRAGLQAELDGLSVTKATGIDVDAVIERVERLADILNSKNQAKVKELMHSLIERIDLWFRRDGRNFRLAKGNCVLIGPGKVLGCGADPLAYAAQPVIFSTADIPAMQTPAEATAQAVRELDAGDGVTMPEIAERLGLKGDCVKRRISLAEQCGLIESVGFAISDVGGRRTLWRAKGRLSATGEWK